VADFFTICVTVIWLDGWRIAAFTFWLHFSKNFCCRVDFMRNAN